MPFNCSLCALLTPGRSRRVDGKCKLTAGNLRPAQQVLTVWHGPAHAPHVASLKEGDILCRICFPEDQRSQVPRRLYGKSVEGLSLVGQPVAEWSNDDDGSMRMGTVIEPCSGGYLVEWDDVAGATRETLTASDAADKAKLGRWIAAHDAARDDTNKVREQARLRQARHREKLAAAQALATEESELDEPEPAAEPELSDEELSWEQRSLSRVNLFNVKWWKWRHRCQRALGPSECQREAARAFGVERPVSLFA